MFAFVAGARSAASQAELPLQWPLVGRHAELELFTASLGDPRAHGFVIHGAAGVGKTRLADQCLAVAAQAGRFVARATATAGAQSAPLGALAHLLPPGIGNHRDLLGIVTELRPVLREQGTTGPLVLFVDDLHHLDSTSATLLGHLVDADLVFLVATVRTAEAVAAGLEALWQRARVQRIDLDELDRDSLDTLLHLVLRDPVEGSTLAELWRSSGGNVLLLREVVLAGLEGGHLVNQRGVWRLVGPLVANPRLHELIGARLAAVEPAAVPVLDMLALCEPAGLAMLEELCGPEPVEALDRLGLLTVRADGRRQQVTLAHPLYGEVLRGRMPALVRRRLLLEHAERIESNRARRREDAIRLAVARLEATGSADPALLVRAARLARYGLDFPQVERLSRAAVAQGMTPEGGLLLGEALHELGLFTEAEAVLSAASTTSDDTTLTVHLTEIRSRNLMWGQLDVDEALAVNAQARSAVQEPEAVAELTLSEAMLLTYSGFPRDALAVLASIGEPAGARARAVAALAEVPALIGVGRCETAAERAGRAFAEHSQLPDQIAIPRAGIHLITRVYALTECGRLDEAAGLAQLAYDATPATAPPDALMWLAHQRGRVALRAGRIATARRWLREALARCEQRRSVGPHRLVLSALATAEAHLGDVAAAQAAVAELDQLPRFGFVEPEQEMGRAWAQAVAGDLAGARQVLRAAADHAARDRLPRLRGVAPARRGPSRRSRGRGRPADHPGRRRRRGDDAALGGARRRGRGRRSRTNSPTWPTGTRRWGPCCWRRRRPARPPRRTRAGATDGPPPRSVLRADGLQAACEGARTPALRAPVLVVPLTARERDIAALAAQGVTSQQIADQLYLSVRTVNNHLQNVYAKLGVSGRRQLAGVLGERPPPAPPRP